jgi:thiol-disulfide isomerase/thioredoxin
VKKLVIVSSVLVLAALGAYYVSSDSSEPVENSPITESSEMSPSVPNATEANVQAGNYIEYEEGIIEKTPGTKLLFFHAPWCPQCRALESDIKAQDLPKDLTIIKVDYDSSQELKERYGVTMQTTIVRVDDEGNLVDKYVAYDYPNFQSVKDNLL